MKWKQAQKAKGDGAADKPPAPPAGDKPPPPPGLPPSKRDASATALKPPPGLSMMEEMKWKQAQKNGTPPPPPPAASRDAKKDETPPKAQASGSLAAKQKMLEGMFAAQGKGPSPTKPKEGGPAPAKKWDAVDTDAKPDMAGAANALAAKLGGAAAAPKSGGSDVCPDLAKYEKMAKMLPQGAVENAMTRDGVDPGWMFGADCQTCKSDKRPPAKGAGGAPQAAAPAAPQQQQPPPPSSGPLGGARAPPMQQQPQPGYAPQAAAQFPGAGGGLAQNPYQSLRTMQVPQPMYAAAPPQVYAPQGHFAPQAHYAPPPPMGYGAPAQWTQVWSSEYNQVYYTNLATGESSWTPPPGFAAPPMMQQQRPIVTMMYNFQGTGANANELQVMANDQIEVHEVGNDGWTTGRCLRTGQMGLFPSNYAR